MAKKFTFKKEPRETGLRGVGNSPSTQIKLEGKVVGSIDPPHWSDANFCYKVRFAIVQEPTKDDPCPFAWATLRAQFGSESEVREHVNVNFEELVTLGLHKFES